MSPPNPLILQASFLADAQWANAPGVCFFQAATLLALGAWIYCGLVQPRQLFELLRRQDRATYAIKRSLRPSLVTVYPIL